MEQDITFTNPCDAPPYEVLVAATAQDTSGNVIGDYRKFTVPAGCRCTPTPTATSVPLTRVLSFVHTLPGVYSEVFLNIVQAPPNTPVTATLTGPGVESQATQTGTTGTDGKLRLTWRINQFGTYRVAGSVGVTPFSDSITVQ